MSLRILSLVLLLSLSTWAARAEGPVDLRRLSWLQGLWVGVQDGIESEELWTSVKGGALLGLHRDVRAGRLRSWEFLRIDSSAEGSFYFASPRSAPPVAFRLVELGERRVRFENRQHDFPQCIDYWLDDQGRLHARIEGPQDGKTVHEEWVWTRAAP